MQRHPDQSRSFNPQSLPVKTLLDQKNYVDAEPMQLVEYEGMKQRQKSMTDPEKFRLPEALDRLIQLYTETNKLDEVKKWQAEKDKIPKAPDKK